MSKEEIIEVVKEIIEIAEGIIRKIKLKKKILILI